LLTHQKKMWEIVRTFYGVGREDGVRMSLGRMLRCKVCGLYFWEKEKAQEHRHEMPNMRRMVNSNRNKEVN